MRARFRRDDWLIGLAVVALVVLVTAQGALRGAEGVVYDAVTGLADPGAPSDEVVIVAIDDRALEALGPWPWSRYALGEINALIARGEPRAVGYALPLERPQNEHARQTLRELYEDNRSALGPRARELMRRAIRDMGTDRVLAASFERSGGVVLGARYDAGDARPASLPELPAAMGRSAVPADEPAGPDPLRWFAPAAEPIVERVRPPVDALARSARSVGLGPPVAPDDGATRRMLAPVLRYGDRWLPAFPVAVYAQGQGVAPRDTRLTRDGTLEVGARRFPAGPGRGVYPAYPRVDAGESAFRTVSAADVHAGAVDPGVFRDRTVLVGPTAPSLTEPLPTAGGARMPVEAYAAEVSSLLTGDLYRVPDRALWARLGAFVLVALYLALLLPRLHTGTALAFTGLLVVVAASAEVVLLLATAAWVPLVAPTCALLAGHAVLGGKRAVAARLGEFQRELNAAYRELAGTHREAGRLDEAFRRLQHCPADAETLEQMYALGLDFERRRRFPEAAAAFRFCDNGRPGFRDAGERARRNDRLQDSVALGGNRRNGSTQTLVFDDEALQKPMLGRYEIERELGKGAMGTVYLGRDPRIGREVAIKTMPLDQEFEGQSLREVKQRFLREAETAGRLVHENIVTVHDVGEEQDLAWIAMDYLGGTPMVRFCEPGELLPPGEVFEVLAQVADALATAHAQNVVHRDIKPDNIIYDRDRGKAVVTDFGVACILDQRHTRTGTILGSPSYMSPEQLAARELDGRSDLFSMGVTLYQLLTGELPFVGDSMSNLMYRIANERHREVKRLRPDLPTCATTITNRCLEKDPARRYTSATQLAQALRRCRAKLEG